MSPELCSVNLTRAFALVPCWLAFGGHLTLARTRHSRQRILELYVRAGFPVRRGVSNTLSCFAGEHLTTRDALVLFWQAFGDT